MNYNFSLRFLLQVVMLSLISLSSEPTWHCELISLADVIAQNPQISYQPCRDAIPFEYKKTWITQDHFLHPHAGSFLPSFVLTMPEGKVMGQSGYVVVDNKLIPELVWQGCFLTSDELSSMQQNPTRYIKGRVAVIAMFGYQYYYHWLVEALGRLALLELYGVEYDYIYVPSGNRYIAETLELWGIDPAKIIYGTSNTVIQAEQLIVPSLIATAQTYGAARLAHYMPEYLLKYIKEKLMSAVDLEHNPFTTSKKIFISRRDAPARRIINEDEVFALFEARGFERYSLTSFSIAQQIQLFHNADIVAGPLGSGSANFLFCHPNAHVIEILQARRDCTFYYLCQTMGISYNCVKTIDFIDYGDSQADTFVPLDIIEDLVRDL